MLHPLPLIRELLFSSGLIESGEEADVPGNLPH
jgi:hypothetical protein